MASPYLDKLKIRPTYLEREYPEWVQLWLAVKRGLCPEWTCEDPKDPAFTAALMFCTALDAMSFQQNMLAGEAFIDTAVDPRNIRVHVESTGYTITPPSAAGTMVRVTLTNGAIGGETPIIIPAGFAVSTTATAKQAAVRFETLAQTDWPMADEYIDLNVIEGHTRIERFDSDGVADLSIDLSATPVVRNSVQVWIGDNLWEVRDTIADADATANVCEISFGDNWDASITFGDGDHGAIPPAGVENIHVEYRTAGGTIGNVAAGTINTVISSIPHPVTGAPLAVTCTNAEGAGGGTEGETLEHAREYARRYERTLDRLVEKYDFESRVPNFQTDSGQSVEVATAVPEMTWGGLGWMVYVLGEQGPDANGAYTPTVIPTNQLMKIYNWMARRKLIGAHLGIQNAATPQITVEIDVKVLPEYQLDAVKNNLKIRLYKMFRPTAFGIGNSVMLSDIHHVLYSTRGVSSAEITSHSLNIPVEAWEFPIINWALTMEHIES